MDVEVSLGECQGWKSAGGTAAPGAAGTVGICGITGTAGRGANFASIWDLAAATYRSTGSTKEASAAPEANPRITTMRTIKPLRTFGLGLAPRDCEITLGVMGV